MLNNRQVTARTPMFPLRTPGLTPVCLPVSLIEVLLMVIIKTNGILALQKYTFSIKVASCGAFFLWKMLKGLFKCLLLFYHSLLGLFIYGKTICINAVKEQEANTQIGRLIPLEWGRLSTCSLFIFVGSCVKFIITALHVFPMHLIMLLCHLCHQNLANAIWRVVSELHNRLTSLE